MDSRGDFGVGTLIIFIAMIVIGAIASAVLIQTAQTTQQQALATGEESEEELVTMLRIAAIHGVDGSDGAFENISILAKLAGGSNPVRFNDTLVQLATDDFDAYYTYRTPLNSTTYCVINNVSHSAQYCATVAQNGGKGLYTREYVRRTRSNNNASVLEGDMVRIYIAANTSIGAGEYYRLYIVPSRGTQDLIESEAPDVIGEYEVALYP